MRFGLSFEEESRERGLRKEWYSKPPPHLPHPDLSMRGLAEVEAKTHGHMRGEFRAGCHMGGKAKDHGKGKGNSPQYSCLENPMDRGAWWAKVRGVTKSWTRVNA